MSETYKIYTPNGIAVKVDKETNKIYFVESLDSHPPAKGQLYRRIFQSGF